MNTLFDDGRFAQLDCDRALEFGRRSGNDDVRIDMTMDPKRRIVYLQLVSVWDIAVSASMALIAVPVRTVSSAVLVSLRLTARSGRRS